MNYNFVWRASELSQFASNDIWVFEMSYSCTSSMLQCFSMIHERLKWELKNVARDAIYICALYVMGCRKVNTKLGASDNFMYPRWVRSCVELYLAAG